MKQVIFLDIETQRMIDEADRSLIGVYWGTAAKLSRNYWSRLRIGWRDSKNTCDDGLGPTFRGLISKRGPPTLAPYLAQLTSPGPIRTIRDLKRAFSKGYFDSDEIIYDPNLHEIAIQKPQEHRRSYGINRRLGLSIAVTWDQQYGFRQWRENHVANLVKELSRYRIVVGANLMGFDYCVLERYVPDIRATLGFRTIDILNHPRWGLFLGWLTSRLRGRRPTKMVVEKILRRKRMFPAGDFDNRYRFMGRYRLRESVWLDAIADHGTLRKLRPSISLGNLANGTLGSSKLGKSKSAPELFRNKQFEELAAYCEQDVALTRDIFFHGCMNGFVNVNSIAMPVRWSTLADRLRRLRRISGPENEADCLRYQYMTLSDTPLLFPVERLFRTLGA